MIPFPPEKGYRRGRKIAFTPYPACWISVTNKLKIVF
jgi:hypothetical protein